MRTVTVELIAKVQVYKREMDSAGRSTKGVKEELDDAARAGKANAVANETVARSIKDAGDEAAKTGTKLGGTGKDAKALGKEMFELEVKIRNAAKELKRTGDMDLDLAKTLRRNRSELRSLTKLRNDLMGLGGDGGDAGRKMGQGLAGNVIESFSNAMSRGGTTFVGAVVGAVAAAGPFLGATLASAVVGTAGLGGIAGGTAMAARDPRVQAAAKALGTTFMQEFGHATEPFTAATIDALGRLETATTRIAGKLAPEFAGLAAHVAPLADALGGLVENTLPGFKKGLQAAQPVLAALERALPELGEDLSDMFESMAENPEAAAAAMHDLLTIVGQTAKGIGTLTHFLSSYYEVLIKVGTVTTGWANNLPDWLKAITPLAAVADYFDHSEQAMRGASNAAPELKDNLGEVGESAEVAAKKVRDLSDAIGDYIGIQLGVDQAVVSWHKGLRELNEELHEGKRTLRLNTEEGLANRDAMLDMIAEAERLRQKTFEQTKDLEGANAQYQANIQTLYNMGLAAGFSRKELDALFGPYINGPRIAVTEFQFPGLLKGLADARALAALLGSISAAARSRGGDNSGYGGGRAGGGPMDAGKWYTVGENGVEVVSMHAGGGATVYNNKQTQGMMSGASGGASVGGWYGASVVPGGGGTQTIVHEHRHTVVLTGREMLSGFRREIELGGGDVQLYLGSKRRT